MKWVTKFDLMGITFDLDHEKMLDKNVNKNIKEAGKVLMFL